MSRTPNSEQKLAIEHHGGVLLRAGAGSGKTFVLVEHIAYLTQNWIDEYKRLRLGTFEDFIREKYSQVVMMTFTKKAAGEMSIRLADRLEEICKKPSDDQAYWEISNECLPLLMVTTIDGFCRKLIAAGFFPHLSTEAKIIFVPERKDQVRELIEEWFVQKASTVSAATLDIVIRDKEPLLKALCNIFNDPGLRLAWKDFTEADAHPDHLDRVIHDSFKLNNLEASVMTLHELQLPADDQSAFEKGMSELQATGLPVVDSIDKLTLYQNFFDGKTLRPEAAAKKKCAEYTAAHEARKNLRDWVKVWHGKVNLYKENYDAKIKPWVLVCLELFHWIDTHLDPNQGLTFGDIEYLVALGLKNPEDRKRIQKAYQYFIVDEFQDTSALQFQIIQELIGKDYSRLFCVGDAKQAIYGFRGGELSVFTDCAELVPQVLSLANNYRSLPTIINFNNSLFRTVLPLGQGFEGEDAFTVHFDDQRVPDEVEAPLPGEVQVISHRLQRDLEQDGKFRNEHINRIEAKLIADSIALQRELCPDEVCTVLYSKLKPSAELIKFLMAKGIGFTAQVKTDLTDDPLVGIFIALMKRQFDRNPVTRNRFPIFVIESYLEVLGQNRTITEQMLDDFTRNTLYWGPVEAFRKFIFQLKITNENSDLNLEVIDTINELFHQDQESILSQLSNSDNERISLELRWGENSQMVQIMTAHASKGLEFDTVYLGGIYTNGRENNDGSLFGDRPASFKWYADLSQRERYESPFYLYEKELSDYKSFSESKRLFYVACTRAKRRLIWVDLEIPEKTFSIPSNSWIDGLSHWQKVTSEQLTVPLEPKDFDHQPLIGEQSKPQLPLFFYDTVGVIEKVGTPVELAISAELSVTRLNSLVDCPRKFYFQNILKLKEPGRARFNPDISDEEVVIPASSAERGTRIHAQIAQGIDHNFIVPRESFGGGDHASIQWALDLLKPLAQDFSLMAEQPLKFKLFHFMVSGIPDLVLESKGDQKSQIWDFKTGRINSENLSHYWIQLKAYAYGLYQLGRVQFSSEVELKLIFVDQKEVLTKVVTFEDCRDDLFPLWQSQNRPWEIKSDHCSQCSYGDICPR